MNQKLQAFFQSRLFKRVCIITSCIIAVLFILFFTFRNIVLHNVIENKIAAFNKKYPAKLIIDNSCFTGLTGIELSGVRIIPDDKDTLLDVSDVYARLKLLPLIFGNIKIGNFEISGTNVNIEKHDSTDNFSFLLSKKNKNKLPEKNYASRLDKLTEGIFEWIPEEFLLKNFHLTATFDSSSVELGIDEIHMADGYFKAPIEVREASNIEKWIVDGSINKRSRTASVRIYAEKGKFTLPVVKKRWGLLLSFDTLKLGIGDNSFTNENFLLNGYASVAGLLLHHRRISMNDVKMGKASVTFNFKVGKDFIELDSTSALTYNNLTLNPYILYKKEEAKQLTFRINNEFYAQDFFSSLPSGLFTNFEGMKTSGMLQLHVDFFVDMKQPDSLKFDANLSGIDFKVLKYGVTDFAMINGPFTFTAYEDGNPVKSFLVSEDNPDYTSLDNISSCMREAVMVSENGGYYSASGFDVNSLRLAIIEDIKQRRFVRGGSTIEMQLVKNVFLTKNKTVARKFEELLIVWLMETGNLCSKDRMFEVYLNVVEWGPGIYGISQAADFYFNKRPSQLTPAESIFLASILPRPKWFAVSFDGKGNLIPEQNQAYFSGIASLLLEKEVITEKDTFNILSKVKLKGESRLYMARDTARFKLDSLMMDN
jgi:hypothetical protein